MTKRIADEAEMMRLWHEGLTLRQIAAKVGIGHSAVHKRIRDKVPGALGPRPPAWVGRAKEMRRAGASYREIARACGVNHSHVWERLNRPSRTSLILSRTREEDADAR